MRSDRLLCKSARARPKDFPEAIRKVERIVESDFLRDLADGHAAMAKEFGGPVQAAALAEPLRACTDLVPKKVGQPRSREAAGAGASVHGKWRGEKI